MKRVYIALFSAISITCLIAPTNFADAKTVKRANVNKTSSVKAKATEIPKHNIVTFPDGSQLDLTTGQVVKNATAEKPIPLIQESKDSDMLNTKNAVRYTMSVGLIYCDGTIDGKKFSSTGSGWLIKWQNPERFLVYTNEHVVDNASYCTFQVRSNEKISKVAKSPFAINHSPVKPVTNKPSMVFDLDTRTWVDTDSPKGKTIWQPPKPIIQRPTTEIVSPVNNAAYGVFELNLTKQYHFNYLRGTDFSAIEIGKNLGGDYSQNDLDYQLTNVRHCSSTMQLGSKVIFIGYPSYASQWFYDYEGTLLGIKSQQQITEGEISGYDKLNLSVDLPYPNYFVSAKIDHGNSGGLALSQDEQGVCILGIPTWKYSSLTQENGATSQAVVQNIANITNK